MIVRGLAIVLTICATAALWFGYMNLGILRGTPLSDFRYIVFAVAAFLSLSLIEWALSWIKTKAQGSDNDH